MNIKNNVGINSAVISYTKINELVIIFQKNNSLVFNKI